MKRVGKIKETAKEMWSVWKIQWDKMKLIYVLVPWYIFGMCFWIEPLAQRILESILKMYGYSYITAEMMFSFMAKPIVIAYVFGLFFVLGLFMSVIYGFSYHYLYFAKLKRFPRIWNSLIWTIKDVFHIIRKRRIGIGLLVGANILLQNSLTVGIAFHKIPSLKYVFRNFMKLSYAKYYLNIFMIVLIMFVFLELFTLPYMIFEKQGFKEARKNNHKLLKHHFIHAFLEWIFWTVVASFIAIAFYYIVMGFCVIFIRLFVEEQMRIAVLVSMQTQMYRITLVMSIVFNMTFHVCGNFRLFHVIREKQGENTEKSEYMVSADASTYKKMKIVGIIAIVLVAVDVILVYDQVANGGNVTFAHMGEVGITSHRGDSRKAPENTMPAIELALDTEADYVEIDVQETKDGEVVLMHDPTMKRTTGVAKKVCDLTLEEIKQLDAGKWFSEKYKGTQIPTLREVLEACKGKVKLNIEIKSENASADFEQKVVNLIKEYDFSRQCVITSARKKSLRKVKKLTKDIRTGYILSTAYGRYYLDREIDFVSMRSTMINERVVRMSHKYGKEVYVWTVNNKEDAVRLSQLGVDNLITDRPVYIRNVVYEQSDHISLFTLLKQSLLMF